MKGVCRQDVIGNGLDKKFLVYSNVLLQVSVIFWVLKVIYFFVGYEEQLVLGSRIIFWRGELDVLGRVFVISRMDGILGENFSFRKGNGEKQGIRVVIFRLGKCDRSGGKMQFRGF